MEKRRTSGRKMKKKIFDLIFLLLRLSLGVVFIAASLYKIQSPGAFAHQIYNYQFLPGWAINPMAIVVPWLQLLCGVCLLFNKVTRGANILVVLMMIAFQIAVASALMRGLNISCGCFKSGGSPATWLTFLRDTTLLLLAAIHLWWITSGKNVWTLPTSPEM